MTNHVAIRPVELSPSKALAAESVRARATREEDIHAIAPKEPEAIESAGGDHDSDDSHETSAKGVIRLLESGHFRGVADVRLRINFFDELQARRDAVARPMVEQAGETFTTAVTGGINDVVASLGLEEALSEPIGAFTEALGSALADFSGDTAALEQSLRDAFGELLVSIQASTETDAPAGSADEEPLADAVSPTPIDPAILDASRLQTANAVDPIVTPVSLDAVVPSTIAAIAPIAIDAAAETTVTPITIGDVTDTPEATDVPNVAPTETDATVGDANDVTTAPTLDESLASLQELFDSALTQLLSEFDAALQPTPLTEANGNGKAYDRFQEAYLDLLEGRSTLDERG